MRFAIATADKNDGVLNALLAKGWEPLKLFTFTLDRRFHGEAVTATAEQLGIPVQVSRLTDADLGALAAQGCQALVVSNYRWRIGDWRPHLPYAINFHPSPLPEGRGPWPLVRALREGRTRWGVSCHQLAPDFDSGDLLLQEHFDLADDETQEGLDLRCQMALRRLAAQVALDLPGLWRRAQPQGDGSYWQRWTAQEQQVDLQGDVAAAQRQLRAFGLIECTVKLGVSSLWVHRAVAWREPHAHAPGALVHANGRAMVFALKDGYLGLLEWSMASPKDPTRAG
jgi:methionyl-tRNA formyltransferase